MDNNGLQMVEDAISAATDGTYLFVKNSLSVLCYDAYDEMDEFASAAKTTVGEDDLDDLIDGIPTAVENLTRLYGNGRAEERALAERLSCIPFTHLSSIYHANNDDKERKRFCTISEWLSHALDLADDGLTMRNAVQMEAIINTPLNTAATLKEVNDLLVKHLIMRNFDYDRLESITFDDLDWLMTSGFDSIRRFGTCVSMQSDNLIALTCHRKGESDTALSENCWALRLAKNHSQFHHILENMKGRNPALWNDISLTGGKPSVRAHVITDEIIENSLLDEFDPTIEKTIIKGTTRRGGMAQAAADTMISAARKKDGSALLNSALALKWLDEEIDGGLQKPLKEKRLHVDDVMTVLPFIGVMPDEFIDEEIERLERMIFAF